MTTELSPGLLLIAAGFLLPLLPRDARPLLLLGAPLALLALVWALAPGSGGAVHWLGLTLMPVRTDALAQLFGTVFAVATFAGGLFALQQPRWPELAAALIYAGGAVGAVFAGDLVTLFVFWEVMAIASTVIIWLGGEGARAAGLRYAVIHFLGGAILMAGVAGQVAETGSAAFGAMVPDGWARIAILAAFLVNAGAPPVSPWVADAYPRASWSGTVFLSAFTTKTAVYALIRGFPGAEILIVIGLVMVAYAILYALLEDDVRRLLSYSIVGQVGYMVVAVGIGTPLALNGAAAHAFVHILYKALLLMASGQVLLETGRARMSELGGLSAAMPRTAALAVVGAMAISALPLTAGFVSKSMIAAAAAEAHLALAWFALTAASAAAFVYVGLRMPWHVFWGAAPPQPFGATEAPPSALAAMGLMAAGSILFGLWPSGLFALLPGGLGYAAWKPGAVVFQLTLLAAGAAVFWATLEALAPRPGRTVDLDWLWRRGGQAVVGWMVGGLGLFVREALAAAGAIMEVGLRWLVRAHGPGGRFGRPRQSGSMALWMTVLLGGFLVLSYV